MRVWVLLLLISTSAWAEPVVEPAAPSNANAIAATVSEDALLTSPHWEANLTVAVPAPLNIGLTRRVNPRTEFFASVGYFDIGVGNARRVNTSNIDVGTRWYPWNTHFYLGLNARYMRMNLSLPVSLDSSTGNVADSTISVGGLYIVPAIGWTWQLSSNLTLATELGLQVGLITSGNASSNGDGSGDSPAMIDSLSNNSARAMTYYSRFPLPNLTLFRLGWKI